MQIMMQTAAKDTCAGVTVAALSLKYDNGGQYDEIMMQNYAKDTCASVTVSALSVEAAAWKTGHFQNRG